MTLQPQATYYCEFAGNATLRNKCSLLQRRTNRKAPKETKGSRKSFPQVELKPLDRNGRWMDDLSVLRYPTYVPEVEYLYSSHPLLASPPN